MTSPADRPPGRRRLTSSAASILLAASIWANPSASLGQEPADLVLRHGEVYTVDAARSWAEAIAIRDGILVEVGTDSAVTRHIGASTTVVDLNGRMVLPGFHDSHVHPVSGGVELLQCDLNGSADLAEVQQRIRQCAERAGPGQWIVGGGWDLPTFTNGVAQAADLDRLVGNRPAYLTSSDAHSAWVSSAALALAGVSSSTDDPPQGTIVRDAEGQPVGTLREAAMRLVGDLLPETTDEQRLEGLRRSLAMAASFGITSLVEANADEATLRAYDRADEDGWLTAKVLASQYVDPAQGAEQVAMLTARGREYGGDRFSAGAAKIFVDGVIEGQTGALLEPYLGTGSRGVANFTPDQLMDLAIALDAAGFQIHAHAIGDRAIRMMLDAIEGAQATHGISGQRHQLAHIQLWDPVDIPRMRQLGVIANFQPLWAYADSFIRDLTEPVLGPERSRWLYPIASLMESGAIVVAGSDWSVTTMNPLPAIQVAVTRRPTNGSLPVWIPEQRTGLAQIIAAYTINGAYLMGQEDVTGSIERGKAADLVVLDRNLFEIDPMQIHSARVVATLVDGEAIYDAGELNLP